MKSGDIVILNVIKRIIGNKWAVGLQGRVIPAYSDLNLVPGKSIRALVTRSGDRYVLKLTDIENSLHELLLREGLSPDKVSERIVAGLFRCGLIINAKTVHQIKKMLNRMKLNPKRFSRLIALLLDKKLDISSTGIEDLIKLLGYGEGNPEKERRFKRRKLPAQEKDIADELKNSLIERQSEADNSLMLFNHLKGNEENWIIIPYSFSCKEASGGNVLYGTIRIQYDPFQDRPKRFVLVVNRDREEIWYFNLCAAEKEFKLNIFCNSNQGIVKGRAGLRDLEVKLQNLGVKIDDTIREDSNFDGFSLPDEGYLYRSVDTVR